MKLSLSEEQEAIRQAHLSRESELYEVSAYGKFTKLKDWDEKGPEVIWGGTIVDSSLKEQYKIQIHYTKSYPYRRPVIVPIEPKIINQRHQLPNLSNRNLPGSLCILPFAPDYWRVGITCETILERIVKWFRCYEAGTLGDEFAAPEIEIYFPGSYRNSDFEVLAADSLIVTEEKTQGNCLIYPTSSSNFAFLTTANDSQSTDEKFQEVNRLKKLILPDEKLDFEKTLSGYWFKLKSEPKLPVPLNSADLINVLVENDFDWELLFNLGDRKPAIVGLLYPTTVPNELHWLLFKTKFSRPPGKGLLPERYKKVFNQFNKQHSLSLFTLNHINVQTIFRRVSGYEIESMLEKKCLLLGCGSIGSTVAKELVKAGIGQISIIDKEVLKTGNLCRHELGINYLDQPKATAMKLELHRKNPFAQIEASTYDPVVDQLAFSEEVEKADIVISCFANDSTESFVNTVCRKFNKPVIYCRAYLEARLGEIFLDDGTDNSACFQCAANVLSDAASGIPRPPVLTYEEQVNFDGDCGVAFLPASSADLGLISLQCVRLTLNFLQNKVKDQNYWLIRGREFNAIEYVSLDGQLREPFKVHSFNIPKSEECYL